MEEIVTKFLSFGSLVITVLIISFLISVFTKSSSFYSNILKKWGIQIIFIFSLMAMLGSLAMSLIFTFQPCDLCWYQRMFMYPIVFVSGFAWYKKDFRNGAIYSLMLSIIGALIAVYHILLQNVNFLKNSPTFCSPNAIVDCSVPEFVHFGFVTIPYISLTAFVLIIISAFYVSRKN